MGVSLLVVGVVLGTAGTCFAQTGGMPAASPPASSSSWSNAIDEPVLRFEKDPDAIQPTAPASPVMRFSKDTPTTGAQPKSLAVPPTSTVPAKAAPSPAKLPTIPSASDGLRPAAFQNIDKGMPKVTGEENQEYFVQLEPPGPQRLFQFESEKRLQERMRQEALEQPSPSRLEFPTYKPLTEDRAPPSRSWPSQTMQVEPNYVCYDRLYFQQINVERYGWDFGFIAPLVSAGEFFKDVALLPYHMGTEPFRCYECSTGYCLPGDPVPLLCYPPHLSLTGAAAEAGVVLGILAIF
jgi:hypothetical protein